ncbi:MAG: pyruvate formate lyase family protein, partial [Desulfobacterales bacterium]
MNTRIRALREQSVSTPATVSVERAQLVTEFYSSGVAQKEPVPLQRARLFHHLMTRKALCINKGELIVGERGPAPKATPTYPEVCLHSIDDLETLNAREKVAFGVDDATRRIYRDEIIPFWQGKSIRERLFRELPREWQAAYRAGVFTEFMEQRSPGHTAMGDTIYRKGFNDLRAEIDAAIQNLDFLNDPEALDKREQLQAMAICAEALIAFARRHAEALDALAAAAESEERRGELQTMAAICRRVPAEAPRTFWEALQYYWFVHLGVITELNPWDAFNPGRLDQHLYPFYQADLAAGRLTREQARELLSAFWVKFNNHPAPPKVGITAKESNTYVDFALINLGGVKADGSDGVNELTYLILDVIEEMRLLQPSSMVQVSKKSPERFLRRALKIVQTGFGQPSIFNT